MEALTPEVLRTYLQDEAGADIDSIDDTTLLFSSGLVDSFAMVGLIVFVEKHAQIKMSPGDVNLDNLDSIGRIVDYAARKRSAS